MTEYGPPIPHNPHGYTVKDGTFYPAVCPWPDEFCQVALAGNPDKFLERAGKPASDWRWTASPHGDHSDNIISYRLRADHPVYTSPKVSRMRREPDLWVNDYADGTVGTDWETRECANEFSAVSTTRIGIWRIYLKPQLAHSGP